MPSFKELQEHEKAMFTLENIHIVYNLIENMCAVYDLETTTLKDFLRDVKQAHALQNYLANSYFNKLNT